MLKFRPHHFLCALCFQGRGYNPTFIANFEAMMSSLNMPGGEKTTIQVTPHTDSICKPCPHRREKHCTSEEKIQALDAHHAKALHLHPGDELTWHSAKKRIKENITTDVFHQICQSCEWKDLGICEEVVKSLR